MRNAIFRDSDGVLLGHGFCAFSPQAGQTAREVTDDFPFSPLRARWNGTTTEEYAPPPFVPGADDHEQVCRDFLNGATGIPEYFSLRRAFIAKAISDECYRLGINPGAIASPQLIALRNRIAAIYKAI